MSDLNEWIKNMSPDTLALNVEAWGDSPPAPSLAGISGKGESHLESQFAQILDSSGFSGRYDREYRFHSIRRWRFDFAVIGAKIAFEVEGGVWNRGRHTRGKGFIADCEKYNEAQMLGWRVFRFTSEHVKDGSAFELVSRLADEHEAIHRLRCDLTAMQSEYDKSSMQLQRSLIDGND